MHVIKVVAIHGSVEKWIVKGYNALFLHDYDYDHVVTVYIIDISRYIYYSTIIIIGCIL